MFSSEEELGEDNMWYCPTCKEQVQAHKKMELFKLPDVLIVHLKRFSHNRWHRQKLNVPVDYPLDGLELSKYLHGSATADAPTSYSLVGVSLHSGVRCCVIPMLACIRSFCCAHVFTRIWSCRRS